VSSGAPFGQHVPVPDDAILITTDDLARLNRLELRRVAAAARWVATGLFVVAALGAAAWAWSMVHAQVRAEPGFGPGGPGISFTDRVDLLAATLIELVLTGVLAAGGVVVRLLADVLVDRSGGTLCGYQVGDRVDGPDDDDGDDGDFRPLTPFAVRT
jgi:hypothetical protein